MDLTTALLVTFALLVLNGFFVASEFALVAARRPRLERAAARGSRTAASAVAGISELSLMLAGAQLGITMSSLGLGLVSEPVIAHTLTPLFHSAGLPDSAAHALAFVLALGLVTFLHTVVGEMAPKSWAIIMPERSAMILAVPFRAFTRAVRPVLAGLNAITNLLLRLVRVSPRDAVGVSRTPEQLRSLVLESRRLGLIAESDLHLLTAALDAPKTPLTGLVVPEGRIVTVSPSAAPAEIVETAARTGRLRLMVRGAARGGSPRMVHVRDAYLARARGMPTTARELSHPVPVIPAGAPVTDAVAILRERRSHLGLVRHADGRIAGLVELDTLVSTLLTPA
ncbi:membrane protein [Actinomadura sp. NBRC 104412]|uniref:hemolysin family protein n=1 Tax=Actinomadura sp. NBRC 104412 TaxID=3032203 RepID=UPI0024A29E6B|nr:hemolysin family protein [Actinomadura sp. NBRC 104412]GLZ03765.1 membrane protein [Actinomadura sp. NBRC 104412]